MFNPEDVLRKMLEQIAAEENIENFDMKIEELNTGGSNYTSAIYRAIISAPKHDDIDLFAKVAIVSEKVRELIQADYLFGTEQFFYKDMVNVFNEMQDKFKVPEETRLKFPKFYGYNTEKNKEALALENLMAKGYTTLDKKEAVDWDFASKAVEELAKLHTLSFAYKHKYPEDFAKNTKKLNIDDTISFENVTISFNKAAESVYQFVPEDLKERLRNFVANNFTSKQFLKHYGSGKWAVMVHGDYRTSNMLFKRQGGKITSLVPIDYQTLHLGSPSTDLLYFIYSGTDEKFRRLYFKKLLDHYYETLSKFLNCFNLDSETVFSRQDFDEDFKEMLGYGLSVSISLLPVITGDLDDGPNAIAERSDMAIGSVGPNEAFKTRFIPILNDFVNWGIL